MYEIIPSAVSLLSPPATLLAAVLSWVRVWNKSFKLKCSTTRPQHSLSALPVQYHSAVPVQYQCLSRNCGCSASIRLGSCHRATLRRCCILCTDIKCTVVHRYLLLYVTFSPVYLVQKSIFHVNAAGGCISGECVIS